MIDSHTHLHLCEADDAQLVAGALAAGLTRMLTVGTDIGSCRAAIAAAERFPGQVWAAVGQHPTAADELDIEALSELAAHPRVLAVGETGLDYHHDRAPRPAQSNSFVAHIELARAVGKPLIIHTREADDDTLALLAEHAAGLRVLLHCFSMPDRLDQCLAAGYWISFAGNVTFAPPLAAAAERVPAERLLVETDAPYLTPKPLRGQPNEPAGVVHTARFLAERRGVSYAQLEVDLERCASDLLGW